MLEVDTNDFDTHFVLVQDTLHDDANTRTNLVAFFGHRCVHFHFSNHLADSCFRSLHNGIGGVLGFKQIRAGIRQSVLHSKFDFQNIFVFGQHGRLTQTSGFDNVFATHIDGTNLRHKHQFMALNGVRHTPVKTSAYRRVISTELGNHTLLAFLHDKKPSA